MVVINSNNKKVTQQQIGDSDRRNVVARLLVLGDRQVGKSASIVRYTTGRFIQQYSSSTNNWLYRHQMSGGSLEPDGCTLVELLEQKDVKFCNSSNFFTPSSTSEQQQSTQQTLASRVAQDQQLANELHEKQDLLKKLHWADAYIVIYAINDRSSFNKAIKYLNLIANNINSPLDTGPSGGSLRSLSRGSSCSSSSCSSGSSGASQASAGSSGSTSGSSSKFFSRLSPGQQQNIGKLSLGQGQAQVNQQPPTRRPILLLGNKRDLERSGGTGRQVSASDGRLLAMRHQSMFAEVSIAESQKLIESCLATLIDQIEPSSLHLENHISQHQRHLTISDKLIRWMGPNDEVTPVYGNLIKSPLPATAMVAQSSRITGLRSEAIEVFKPMVSVARSVEVKNATTNVVSSSTCGLKRQIATCKLLRKSLPQQAEDKMAQCGQQQSVGPATPPSGTSSSSSSYRNRYRNLKSSFKKASIAIVGSKSLAKSSSKPPMGAVGGQKRSSVTSSDQDSYRSSISELDIITEPDESAELSGYEARAIADYKTTGQVIGGSSLDQVNSLPIGSGSQHDRLKRSLLKYKSRRKTVAFEQIAATSAVAAAAATTETSRVGLKGESKLSLDVNHNDDSVLDHCDRSKSSLSTSTDTTHYNSVFVLWDPPEQSPSSSFSDGRSASASSSGGNHSTGSQQSNNLTLTRHNSNTTLSRASTSGGSYEGSGDELAMALSSTIPAATWTVSRSESNQVNKYKSDSNKNNTIVNSGMSELLVSHMPLAPNFKANNSNNPSDNKKRGHHLVKSMQSTLSSLTKSSNIPGQAVAKRSFCSSIFRQSNDATNVKKVAAPVMSLAKTEQIGATPVMIGFCK